MSKYAVGVEKQGCATDGCAAGGKVKSWRHLCRRVRNHDDRAACLILYEFYLKVELQVGKESEEHGFQHTDQETEE